MVTKFQNTGSIRDGRSENTTRQRPVLTPAKLEEIRQLFENEPTLSIRRASQRLKLGYRTVQRALRNHIDFFPYKVQSMQSLTSQNFASRLAFARMIKTKIDRREININRVWFSDEAHFYLNGYVNKQNYRFWGSENPNVAVSRTLHPQRLTVWAALCAEGIIGPILFHSSVNSKNYLEMLRDTFIPTAHGLNKIASFWFQQDGARPSRSRDVFSLLYEHFGNQVIALDFKNHFEGGMDWPPYSPDLNPCDFFLWGYLKDRVYQEPHSSLSQLESALVREVSAIEVTTLKSVLRSFANRLDFVIKHQGAHFENFVNKT